MISPTISDSLYDELRATAETISETLRDPDPEFVHGIQWTTSYDGLFKGEFVDVGNKHSAVDKALRTGRVLLTGMGGVGKSILLNRIFNSVIHDNTLPIIIRFSEWSGKDYEHWQNLTDTPAVRMDYLLREHGRPSLNIRQLDLLPPDIPKLVLVDGLNELSKNVANDLATDLGALAHELINISVIATDRLVRRKLEKPSRWTLGLIDLLTRDEVQRILTEEVDSHAGRVENELLRLPYFLDAALQDGPLEPTRSRHMRLWFIDHCDLDVYELKDVADAAFSAYEDHSRSFEWESFVNKIGTETAEKLLTAGAVEKDPGSDLAYFDHHLKHDFLAAVHLAQHPSDWTREAFDRVTMRAGSFDTLAMTIENMEPPKSGQFIRSVYDWSLYGAAYALSEGFQAVQEPVSDETATIILAMLAERKWDIIASTAQQARDALLLFPDGVRRPYVQAESPDDLFAYVANLSDNDAPEWFREWKRTFTIPYQRTDYQLETIRGTESVLGWTLANTLKRVELPDHEITNLIEWYQLEADSPTVRWRIVHLLGAFPSTDTSRLLIRAVSEDNDRWVQYGAIRSLVEQAALTCPSFRNELMETLGDLLPSLPENTPRRSTVLTAFERAIILRQAPPDWVRAVTGVLSSLSDHATSTDEVDRWTAAAHELRRHIQSNNE